MKNRLAFIIGTVFYIGRIPGAPGTYASIAASLAFYLIHAPSHWVRPELHVSAICLVTFAGILASDVISRSTGIEDPQFVVIDEVAGQLIAFLFLPFGIVNLILGTLFFRLFDIWKPFPIRRLESLGRGVGVMADDVLAGVYANLLLHAVNVVL
ncbi:MAG: phosphatidylglycerophosphatase A [Acidobacteria bacterium]|nr:phosphatidylglycerophosphatase A [Acidobacteriota bacterium]